MSPSRVRNAWTCSAGATYPRRLDHIAARYPIESWAGRTAVQCIGATGLAVEGAASLMAAGPTLGGSMLLFAGLSFYGHNALIALSEKRLEKAFLDPGIGAELERGDPVGPLKQRTLSKSIDKSRNNSNGPQP